MKMTHKLTVLALVSTLFTACSETPSSSVAQEEEPRYKTGLLPTPDEDYQRIQGFSETDEAYKNRIAIMDALSALRKSGDLYGKSFNLFEKEMIEKDFANRNDRSASRVSVFNLEKEFGEIEKTPENGSFIYEAQVTYRPYHTTGFGQTVQYYELEIQYRKNGDKYFFSGIEIETKTFQTMQPRR